MRKFYTLWVSLAALLLMGGCGARPYVQTSPATIILKSPKLKFADSGYIRSNENLVALELFSAGQAVAKIEVENLICVEGEGCMRKSAFNADYLSIHYPDTLLENILRSQPIYDGQNLVRYDDGFEQNIVNDAVDIRYRIRPGTIYFKDQKNSVLIKIKKEKE
ncbi:MAG: hypothetical protein PF439_01305 [Helicobacteraceae bacterium]|jgi:hypothetical protein|nr:hypothetical protein [Helicobacteraceae bacterium]